MKRLIIFLVCIIMTRSLLAQISFDTTVSATQLVDRFLAGKGIRVGNVKYTGPKLGIGYFVSQSTVLGIDSGIILSTGNIFNASGPNNSPFTTTRFTDPNAKKKPKGDRDLNRICKSITWDASVLEFDFIPLNNKISFNYVFGSEEYPEYVGSRYNDVFGFFVDGEKLRNQNIALIPRTVLPVTINTINEKENSGFYLDNDYFRKVEMKKVVPTTKRKKETDRTKYHEEYVVNKKKLKQLNPELVSTVQFDGLTVLMTASCYLIPYKKYHMKIAIGDVADPQYDSGVFLEQGSFSSEKDPNDPKFKDYPDLSQKINFDSLLGAKPILSKKQVDSIEQEQTDYERFELTNINFETDSYIIPDTSKDELMALAKYLQTHQNFKCELYGYTDSRGSKKYNQRLSENRANAVMEFITSKKVEPDRIKIIGYNFENPIADNSSEKGRAKNRRVEIVLVEQ